tara:strand:+ start:1901 stop:2458 length:558 start_codon:yes stop_codon:yes gene_type:complete
MKKISNIKYLPFLSALFIVTFISLNNQKQKTNLNILIWTTPTISLASYIAISSGSGFIISYFVTKKIADINQPKLKKLFRQNNNDKYSDYTEENETVENVNYENTLIERDIKDPTPTINANFRVIGKIKNDYQTISNHDYNEYTDTETELDKNNDNYYNEEISDEFKNLGNSYSNDWNDNSFSSW